MWGRGATKSRSSAKRLTPASPDVNLKWFYWHSNSENRFKKIKFEWKWVTKDLGQIIETASLQLPMPCISDTHGKPVKNPNLTWIYWNRTSRWGVNGRWPCTRLLWSLLTLSTGRSLRVQWDLSTIFSPCNCLSRFPFFISERSLTINNKIFQLKKIKSEKIN